MSGKPTNVLRIPQDLERYGIAVPESMKTPKAADAPAAAEAPAAEAPAAPEAPAAADAPAATDAPAAAGGGYEGEAGRVDVASPAVLVRGHGCYMANGDDNQQRLTMINLGNLGLVLHEITNLRYSNLPILGESRGLGRRMPKPCH